MADVMDIPKGFKQTEVGMIPEDWEVRILGELVDFLDGKRRPIKDSERAKMKGVFPYYGASGIIDYVNDFIFDEELILLGEDGENILSRNLRLAFKINGKAWINNHAHVLKPKENFDIDYLTEQLESINYEQYNTGTAQPKLNQKICRGIPIPLPPTKSEQNAISEVLTDADTLIIQLEKLIAKKQAVKQGSMQELLKPKEGWMVKKLEKALKVRHGKSQKKIAADNGAYPILASGGIIGRAKTFLYDKPSVLIGRKGTIDAPQYMETPFWSVDTLFYTEILQGYNPKFIFYMFNLIDWYSYNEASGVPSLNAKTIEGIEKFFPNFKVQSRIAQILTDMDAEIEALERKLEKYKRIKQGMMQALLTGKIRLM